ncbi:MULTISPECIES: hypothetical protein [Niastella]|uniref:Viral A-type inclusion protein n=1 Tax=Niastella soli TaxID=2821487 RepID=A0ABS3YNM6_9BACT|nr:hypothetical protein [Niastella soli]MBO9199488.1 hypothetical protein [Niastella soli]
MSRFIIALVTIGLFVGACNDASQGEPATHKNGYAPVLKTREDSLFHEVMKGHDAGMAKVGKLRKNIAETTHQLDSLGKLPVKKIDAAYKEALVNLQTNLKKADDEMDNWMQQFKLDSLADNKELRVKYLEGEKEKVAAVKEHIFSALQQADSLLKR